MRKKVDSKLSEKRAAINLESQPSSAVDSGSLSIKDEVYWDEDEAKNGVKRYDPEEGEKILADIDNALGIKHYVSLSFADLMSQEFPKARYTLEPFFESGTVNMVSAPPNTWKSWLLFYFASCIASGAPVLGKFPTEQTPVMIVNEEDSFRAIQDRFNLLSITDHTLPIFFRVAQGAKLEKKFIQEIIEECKQRGIGCVMFDSLRSMHEGNENDSTEMQLVLDHLKAVAREGITVIFTHHHRKKSMFSKGDDAEASRGSSAINAAISGHLSLEEEERDSGTFLVVRHLKSKAGEKLAPIELKIEKGLNKIGFVYAGDYKTGEHKLTLSKDAVMNSLSAGECKSLNDFVALEVASKSVIRAALTALVAEGSLMSMTRKAAVEKGLTQPLSGNPKEKVYMLPTEEAQAVEDLFNEL